MIISRADTQPVASNTDGDTSDFECFWGTRRGPMNRSSRCDDIVDLIDRCLVETGFDPAVRPTEGAPSPSTAAADRARRASCEIDSVRRLVRQRRLEADL